MFRVKTYKHDYRDHPLFETTSETLFCYLASSAMYACPVCLHATEEQTS